MISFDQDSYHQRVRQIQTQVDNASTSGTREVAGARKLDLWQEVVGGRTRGRCYGTADLSSNFRRGISSLIQVSQEHPSRSGGFEAEEVVVLREATTRAQEKAARAEEKAARAEERAARVEARYDDLEGRLRAMMERMTALEHQSGSASCSESASIAS